MKLIYIEMLNDFMLGLMAILVILKITGTLTYPWWIILSPGIGALCLFAICLGLFLFEIFNRKY